MDYKMNNKNLLTKLEDLKKEISEVEQAIHDNKSRQVAKQDYAIQGDFIVFNYSNQTSYRKAGSVVSKENLERVIYELGIAQRISCIIREENELTGYVADWNNPAQLKYIIMFNHNIGRWAVDTCIAIQAFGLESCNINTAQKIIELLNNGAGIEGVEV